MMHETILPLPQRRKYQRIYVSIDTSARKAVESCCFLAARSASAVDGGSDFGNTYKVLI